MTDTTSKDSLHLPHQSDNASSDTQADLREKIAELTHAKGQRIDNDNQILVPVSINDLMQLFRESLQGLEDSLPPKATVEIRGNVYQYSPEQEWYDKGQNDTIDRIEAAIRKYVESL